jgi:integrase
MEGGLIEFFGVRSPKTQDLYQLAIKRFFDVNGFRNQEHALFMLREKGADAALVKFVKRLYEENKAPKSILNYVAGVKAFLECHGIQYNKVQLRRMLPRKQIIKDGRPFTKSQVKLVMNMLRPTKRLACWVMWGCGLRIDECLSLKVGDLDLSSDPPKLYVRGTKTANAKRVCFIPSDLASELRKYVAGRRPDEYLFQLEDKPGKIPPNRFRIAFYGALKRVGLLIRDASGRGWIYSPHSLRRGFETALINAGCPAVIVSYIMGHDLGVTQSYYKPSERELAETWKKFEHALRLDIEDTIPPNRVEKMDEKIREMEQTIEELKSLAQLLLSAQGRHIPQEVIKQLHRIAKPTTKKFKWTLSGRF